MSVGLATTVPPVAALYQMMVCPAVVVAVAVSEGIAAGGQCVATWSPPLEGATTEDGPTDTANVLGAVEQLPALATTCISPLVLPAG